MAYVITEPCIGTCDQSCVKVCPVDCIHTKFEHNRKTMTEVDLAKLTEAGRKELTSRLHLQLYIDPEICIDCGACEPECPVDAIFEADAVPSKWHHFIEINAAWFKR